MKKIIRLSESDLTRIIKRVLSEEVESNPVECYKMAFGLTDQEIELPEQCLELVTKDFSQLSEPRLDPKMVSMLRCVVSTFKNFNYENWTEVVEKVEMFYECSKSKTIENDSMEDTDIETDENK